MNPASLFHPAVAAWFERSFAAPTAAQAEAWPAIQAGPAHADRGADRLGQDARGLSRGDRRAGARKGSSGRLPDETQVVYVSPLKALSNDIQRNLEAPLAGIRERAARPGPAGRRDPDLGAHRRHARRRARAHAPQPAAHPRHHAGVALHPARLASPAARMLATTRTVIVDEIHALAPNKRGAHLALSLERLEALVRRAAAAHRPVGHAEADRGGRALPGRATSTARRPTRARSSTPATAARATSRSRCPSSPLEAVMSDEVWEQVYDRLAAADRGAPHDAGLRQHAPAGRAGDPRSCPSAWASARSPRTTAASRKSSGCDAEQRLKRGELKALVATASLELGIDIGEVDLVCQLGSPRSIASFLQRVGRSGHAVGGTPKGRLFPLSRDELVECAALLDSVAGGELDRLRIPEQPLDVLAQQIVAEVAARGMARGRALSR